MIIRARAPLRISFAGGGTDVAPYPALEGGLVLNATINRYAYGTLVPRDDHKIEIQSHDYGMSTQFDFQQPIVFDGDLDLVKVAIRRYTGGDARGFRLTLHSNAPPGTGLGSSSTMMVTLIGLLNDYTNLSATNYELAHLAYTLERHDLGIKGGLQDQYAATFGGFSFLEMSADRVVVNSLRIRSDVLLELEYCLLLCYTGTSRDGGHVIEDQVKRFEDGDPETLAALRTQKELAVAMKNALLQGRLTEFGSLLDSAWHAKRRMSPRISTSRIEEVYDEARKAGALGGKITGAGGGGYMLLYCGGDTRHRVAARMLAMGADVEEFAFEPEGLRTWRVND